MSVKTIEASQSAIIAASASSVAEGASGVAAAPARSAPTITSSVRQADTTTAGTCGRCVRIQAMSSVPLPSGSPMSTSTTPKRRSAIRSRACATEWARTMHAAGQPTDSSTAPSRRCIASSSSTTRAGLSETGSNSSNIAVLSMDRIRHLAYTNT